MASLITTKDQYFSMGTLSSYPLLSGEIDRLVAASKENYANLIEAFIDSHLISFEETGSDGLLFQMSCVSALIYVAASRGDEADAESYKRFCNLYRAFSSRFKEMTSLKKVKAIQVTEEKAREQQQVLPESHCPFFFGSDFPWKQCALSALLLANADIDFHVARHAFSTTYAIRETPEQIQKAISAMVIKRNVLFEAFSGSFPESVACESPKATESPDGVLSPQSVSSDTDFAFVAFNDSSRANSWDLESLAGDASEGETLVPDSDSSDDEPEFY